MKAFPLTRFLLAVLNGVAFAPGAWAACGYTDDHKNDFAEATTIGPGSATGRIEVNEDRDMFKFIAIPGATYTIVITEQSDGVFAAVPDLQAALVLGDRKTVVGGAPKTSISGSSLTLTFNNTATGNAGGPMYIDVRSFAEFYTGAYRVTMIANIPDDDDGDGLPSEWEQRYNLVHTQPVGHLGDNGADGDPDGDCFTNYEELLMGTSPISAASTLKILAIDKDVVKADLQWPVRRNGTYRLRNVGDSESFKGASFPDELLYSHTGPATNISFSDIDGFPPVYKIYRLEFVIE